MEYREIGHTFRDSQPPCIIYERYNLITLTTIQIHNVLLDTRYLGVLSTVSHVPSICLEFTIAAESVKCSVEETAEEITWPCLLHVT